MDYQSYMTILPHDVLSELQSHPNVHSPVLVGRNDTDQTHPNL